MRWGIRTQLLLPVTLLLAGVAAISVTTAVVAAHQARAEVETRLRTVARFLVEESQFPLTIDVLRQLRPLSGADYLLVPPSGPRRTSLEGSADDLHLPEVIADDWLSLHLEHPLALQGEMFLCGGVRLRRGQNAGEILYILYPQKLWLDARWQAVWPSVLLGTAAGLASLALALAQAQRLGRRLQQLERRTRLIAGGDFSPMPLPVPNDEIRDLAGSVNDMAGQLAQLRRTVEQTERLRILGQVSGGLAHQMRNGLTGARLAVQVHLREAAPVDAGALDVALRQLTLLEAHVKRFLDLGRAGTARRERCELASLIGEAIELVGPQCQHAGIRLVWEPGTVRGQVCGDAGQLGGALFNLLGNALDAAGPGGKVEVILGEGIMGEGHVRCWLEVRDTGPGPAPEIADRLFEPFVTGKPEGVGLGLAVVRQVVEAHGGSVSWRRESGLTCFRLELPGGE